MGSGLAGHMGVGPTTGGMWAADGAVPGWLFVVSAVMQLLFLAVVVGGVYLVYRLVAVDTDEDEDEALAELRLAYARGDLDDDEYERQRDVLERE